MTYPDYYLRAFHAYEQGNLNWLAAFEVEAATLAMALRTFPDLGPEAAHARLRGNMLDALQARTQAIPQRLLWHVILNPVQHAPLHQMMDSTLPYQGSYGSYRALWISGQGIWYGAG